MPKANKNKDISSPSRPHRSQSKQLAEGLSKDELLKRLKTLCDELDNVEQGQNHEKYAETAVALANNFLIKHADKDIRLHVARCIAHILRIFVPQPPYDRNQLWTMFDLIIDQLEGIKNPKGSSYDKIYGLLENLSAVNTLAICVQQDFSDLIFKFCKMLFKSVREEHSAKVINLMCDTMVSLIVEAEVVSQQILDTILENIINPKKASHPSAYRLASSVIKKTASCIEPFVQMFFNNALFFEKSSESLLEDRLFDLIYELHRVCPSLLLSVLPQLEFKLKSNNETDRLDVTKMLGKMFSDVDSNLSRSHKPLWQSYLGRFVDISVDVRVECAKQAKHFLVNQPELAGEISEKLLKRHRDPDETVRMAVVTAICDAASENVDCVSRELFDIVAERLRDRKFHIRKDTMMCLGRLYKKIYSSATVSDKTVKAISWIPIKILHCYYQNSVENRLCVERVFLSFLVPVTLGSEERMRRLFKLYLKLDEPGTKAFKCMFSRQGSMRSDMIDILKYWDEHQKTHSEESKKGLTSKISMVAEALPEPSRSKEHLKKLVKMFAEKKFLGMMKTCLETGHDCAKVYKASSAVAIQIGAKNPILETTKAILDRTAPLLIDTTSGKHLVELISKFVNDEYFDEVSDDDDEFEDENESIKRAMELLLCCCSVFPTDFEFPLLYQTLLVNLSHKCQGIAHMSLEILVHVAKGLHGSDKNVASHFQKILIKIFTSGKSSQIKHAAQAINKIYPDSSKIFQKVLENQCKVLDCDSPKVISSLSCIRQIALLAPTVFEQHYVTVIRDFIAKDLLMKDRSVASKSGTLWCDKDALSNEVKTKIQGIKLLVSWLQGNHTKDETKIQPVLRILYSILNNNGDLTSRGQIRPCEMAHMRLVAASSFLKLSPETEYHEFIEVKHFKIMSSVMQDSVSQVRSIFARKLCKGLESLKIPLEYLSLFALAAKEQSNVVKQSIKQMIDRCIHVRNEYLKHHSSAPAYSPAILPEYALPYLIYLLSHLPNTDYQDIQTLKDIKTYLWFFLEAVLSRGDNFSFLKKLAENVKLTKDAIDPDNKDANKAIYAVCDIAIGIITNLSKTHTHLLKDFAGNLVLPKKLFTPLSKGEVNNESYLPKGFVLSPVKMQKTTTTTSKVIPIKITPTKNMATKAPLAFKKTDSGTKRTSAQKKTLRKRVPASSKPSTTQRSLQEVLGKEADDTAGGNEENGEESGDATETSKEPIASGSPEKRPIEKVKKTRVMKVEKPTRSSPRNKVLSPDSGIENTTRELSVNAPADKSDAENGFANQSDSLITSESKKRTIADMSGALQSSLVIKRKRKKK